MLKRYRKKIFHKPIILTAVKVLWQTFQLARPKILDWAWKQYTLPPPPEAVLANWLKIQPQNPKDTD